MGKNLWEIIKNAFSSNRDSGERNGGRRFEIPWPQDAADLQDVTDLAEGKNSALAKGDPVSFGICGYAFGIREGGHGR